MSNPTSDRNLLLGVLALQYGLLTPQQLVAAITAWRLDKLRDFEQVLLDLKIINENGQAKLRAVFDMYVQIHGGDVEKS